MWTDGGGRDLVCNTMMLADLFTLLESDPETGSGDERFRTWMANASRHATALETAARAGDRDRMEAAWRDLANDCRDCHGTYRN